jgi:hypothetical protein
MAAQLILIAEIIAFQGCLFDGAVHPLDLTVGPGVIDLGWSMLDFVFVATPIEDMFESRRVLLAIGELDAVVGENSMDFVG